jgi:NAD(P)-dependent dehydrogenase (short-subunit alcohol dehydrogenase family)
MDVGFESRAQEETPMESSMFQGRVALVTGASRGIGKSVTQLLMERGCTVYVNSRDLARAEAACADLGGRGVPGACRPVAADVSVRPQVQRMVDTIVGEAGRIDFLVNNAGIPSRSSLLDLTDEHWNAVLDINLRGVFLCTQIAARHMIAHSFGRIVNAASYAAWHASLNRGAYAAAKAGIIALTKVWAGELAPFGITVNAYAPGDIATDIIADIRGGSQEALLLSRIALRRFGDPAEVAKVVGFFLSPDADYLTGVVMNISGGKFIVQNPGDAWQKP